jgi:FixJ family two-component response regulator
MNDAIVHLVDDDESFVTATSRLLKVAGYAVRAFSSPARFLAETTADTRGCVVADLDMPEIDGLELQARLASAGSAMPVVFLSGHGDIPTTVRAMREGAVDFLEKHAPKEQLLAAIATALERDAAGHAARTRIDELRRRFDRLTEREHEVLGYVVAGRMNKEIAAALGIHERTVKLHRTAITTKVGVHSAAQLATLAREADVFGSEDEIASPR